MIALVEGAERRKTPNEIALNILLAGLTITFLAAVVTLPPFADLRRLAAVADGADRPARRADPDDDRRAAVGDRHRRDGPPGAAKRAGDVRPRGRGFGRRRRAAAGQDRDDHARQPPGIRVRARRRRRRGASSPRSLSWPRWPTRRRRAARSWCSRRSATACASSELGEHETTFVPFSATTRMSGVDLNGNVLRKGAADAVKRFIEEQGGRSPAGLDEEVDSDRPRRAARRSSSHRTTTCSA